ncbi:hypothetical protein [Streptomyces filamentosus]|uniref:hypothetical protein n=1 Tax=Streptomyces filamentosus TaxID=67294 RepID=UPI0037CF2891
MEQQSEELDHHERAVVPGNVAETIATLRRMLAGLQAHSPLAAVVAASEVEKMGAGALQRAVTSARAEESWETIGRAMGVSRQAAHQRFAKVPFRG